MVNKSKTSRGASTKAKRTATQRMIPGAAKARTSRPATPHADAAKVRGQFAGLSIKQLQAMYLEVVGRPTGSRDRAYVAPVNM
jgi:hypothetical protein